MEKTTKNGVKKNTEGTGLLNVPSHMAIAVYNVASAVINLLNNLISSEKETNNPSSPLPPKQPTTHSNLRTHNMITRSLSKQQHRNGATC